MLKRWIIPFSAVLLWFVLSSVSNIDQFYLPSFIEVFQDFLKVFSPDQIRDLVMTLYRTVAGFVLAGLGGVIFGIVLGLHIKIYKYFEVVIDFFRSVPATALFPLFLLFFGIGDGSKIAIAVFISFWIVLLNTIYGVWSIPKLRIQVGKIYGLPRSQTIQKIIIPGALPQILVGLKVSLSLSLIVIIVTEMFIGTKYGLGQKIYDSYISYDISALYAYIIAVGLLGYFLNQVIDLFERKFIHWAGK